MNKIESINITDTLTQIIYEIIKRSPPLHHIDMNRVMVCVSSNRNRSRGGIYGKLVPLKFENGSSMIRHRGRVFAMPEVKKNGMEQLYILYFYMPRFFDLSPEEKVKVLFHELYHISPHFNGDIRRMARVKAAHGHSKDHFNAQFEKEMAGFMDYVLRTAYMNFLKLDFGELHAVFNRVTGARMKMPRPVPVDP